MIIRTVHSSNNNYNNNRLSSSRTLSGPATAIAVCLPAFSAAALVFFSQIRFICVFDRQFWERVLVFLPIFHLKEANLVFKSSMSWSLCNTSLNTFSKQAAQLFERKQVLPMGIKKATIAFLRTIFQLISQNHYTLHNKRN